jgi:phosphoglycerate dehydrogenase-like enzyme
MLRVLIDRPASELMPAASAKAEFREAARRYPDVASRLKVSFAIDETELASKLARAEVLVGWKFPTADLGARAPALQWIQLTGAGIEHLVPLDWLPAKVKLTNCSGVHSPKQGEFATMALLMLHSHMTFFATAQRTHLWEQRLSSLISGKTAVIVGLGGMGGAAARSARRLGLEVIGITRSGKKSPHADRVLPVAQIAHALPKADFLYLAAPLTGPSRGLIGRRELQLLKPGAGLVNVGRGGLVDEAALVAALRSGRLSGAILDVFAEEPLPKDSPLWDAPNLLVVPHVSSDDRDAYMPRNYDLLLRNCRRFLAGRPLLNRIDPKLEY